LRLNSSATRQDRRISDVRVRSPGLLDRRRVCSGPSSSKFLKLVTCGPCDWGESVHQRILHSRVPPLPLTLAPQDTAPAFPACSCVTPCGISSSILLHQDLSSRRDPAPLSPSSPPACFSTDQLLPRCSSGPRFLTLE